MIENREGHVLVSGNVNYGKTSTLSMMINEDMKIGKGVGSIYSEDIYDGLTVEEAKIKRKYLLSMSTANIDDYMDGKKAERLLKNFEACKETTLGNTSSGKSFLIMNELKETLNKGAK